MCFSKGEWLESPDAVSVLEAVLDIQPSTQDWVMFQRLTQLLGTQMASFGIDSVLQVLSKFSA